MVCNMCRPPESYVNVGFGNQLGAFEADNEFEPLLHVHAAVDAPDLTGDVGRLVS
jgi:hypothetical protein